MPEPKTSIKSFEDLRIFKEARALMKKTYLLTSSGALAKDYGLRDQMRRSSVSIVSNIAEGFERETDPEFIRALYFTKGSCGELRAQFLASFDLEYCPREAFEDVSADCRKLSAGISNLIAYLRDSSDKRGKARAGRV